VREWQNRPLDPVYPVVFFGALRVKVRDEGLVKNKAVYVALALNPAGEKEVLGCGSSRAKARSSGSKWSTSSRRAASMIS
jgi:transposase-like protein